MKKIPKWIIVCIILYIALFSFMSIDRHIKFHTGWDIALHEQFISNTIKGNFFYSNDMNMNYLGNHFNLIALPINVIYYLIPSTWIFLILQAIFISIGSIPLFYLCQQKFNKEEQLFTTIILASYFTFPFFWVIILNDFHFITFTVPIIIWLFYLIEIKSWKWYYVAIFLLLSIKEDVSMLVFMTGIYLIYKKELKHGIYTSIFGIIWFIGLLTQIMPWLNSSGIFGQGYVFFNIRYNHIGNSMFEIIRNLIYNPIASFMINEPFFKVQYLFIMLKQFGFFPILSPASIIALPNLAANLFSIDSYQFCNTSHHSTHIYAIGFVSMVYGLKRALILTKGKFNKYIGIILTVLIMLNMITYGVVGLIKFDGYLNTNLLDGHKCYKNSYRVLQNNQIDSSQVYYKELKAKIDTLDKSKSIKVTTQLFAQVIDFKSAKSTHLEKNCFSSDYLIFDYSDVDSPFIKNYPEELNISYDLLLYQLGYKKVWTLDEINIYEKNGNGGCI